MYSKKNERTSLIFTILSHLPVISSWTSFELSVVFVPSIIWHRKLGYGSSLQVFKCIDIMACIVQINISHVSFLRRCVSMSVLLLIKNDPNLLAFTVVSHLLVLFWRNWRINSGSYSKCLQCTKSLHLTDTYDVSSETGVLVTYMYICAEKRNYWWQSENRKNLWTSYTNFLNIIIKRKIQRHFVLFVIKLEGFFLPFE